MSAKKAEPLCWQAERPHRNETKTGVLASDYNTTEGNHNA